MSIRAGKGGYPGGICPSGENRRRATNTEKLGAVYTCHGFRGDPARLKLAMLTGYFDESGLASSDKFCTVAGFVGNEAQWNAFIADWIPALGQRKNLHMTDLRWNTRYDKIVTDLALLGAIPHRYNLSPVRVGLWHKDVEELLKGKINENFTSPYVMCAVTCISAVLQELIGADDEIMFIFDRQEGRRARTMDILHKLVFQTAKMDRRVKDIDFRPYKSTVCFDPADYYAYGFRENQVNPDGPRAKACLPIARGQRGYGGILRRQQIEQVADHYKVHGLIPGSKWKTLPASLISELLKVGWPKERVEKLQSWVDDRNKKGDWRDIGI